MNVPLLRIAAVFGFFGVALGAFGAHLLKTTLAANGMTDVWEKAVLYQFVHALALLGLAALPAISRVPADFFIAGIILFSGSLYLLALTNIGWLGAITPLGGLCFLIGWGWLVFAVPR